jgi:hypothetical protein
MYPGIEDKDLLVSTAQESCLKVLTPPTVVDNLEMSVVWLAQLNLRVLVYRQENLLVVKAQASGRIVPRAREEHNVKVVVEEAVVDAEVKDGRNWPME